MFISYFYVFRTPFFAAVYFEMSDYDACIEQCEKGVEVGRANRADYKLIGK